MVIAYRVESHLMTQTPQEPEPLPTPHPTPPPPKRTKMGSLSKAQPGWPPAVPYNRKLGIGPRKQRPGLRLHRTNAKQSCLSPISSSDNRNLFPLWGLLGA